MSVKITSITVGVQRIINLGNYENVRYECTATAEVRIDEQPENTYFELAEFCRNQLGKELDRLDAVRKKKS